MICVSMIVIDQMDIIKMSGSRVISR